MIRTYITKYGKKLINLNFVSSINLDKNKVIIYKSTERAPIMSFFFYIEGGETIKEIIECNSEKEAQEEFENVKSIMENYYKKSKIEMERPYIM